MAIFLKEIGIFGQKIFFPYFAPEQKSTIQKLLVTPKSGSTRELVLAINISVVHTGRVKIRIFHIWPKNDHFFKKYRHRGVLGSF